MNKSVIKAGDDYQSIIENIKSDLQSYIDDNAVKLAKQAVEAYEYNSENVLELGSKEKQLAQLNDYLDELKNPQNLDEVTQDFMRKNEIDDTHQLYETLNDLRQDYQYQLEQTIDDLNPS